MIRVPPQRTLVALALVVLVASALAWLSQTIAVEVLAVLVAVAGAYGWSRPLTLIPWIGLGLILAFAFVLKGFLWPLDPRDSLVSLGQILAEYLLMAQAVQFVVKQRDRPLGSVFLLLGVGALLGAGLVKADAVTGAIYQGTVLLFMILIAWYSALDRPLHRTSQGRSNRLRSSLLSLMLLVACVSSVAGSMLVKREWTAIESFLNNQNVRARNTWLPQGATASIGFLRRKQSTLGSVDLRKTSGLDQIALRVSGNETPHYLRGGVFDKYELNRNGQDQWATSYGPENLLPTKLVPGNLPKLNPGERPFLLRKGNAPLPRVVEIWPEVESETLFTALNTSAVAAPVDAVRVDDHEIVEASEFPPGQSYRLFGFDRAQPGSLSQDQRVELTEIPPHLGEILREYADRICKGCKTPREKIEAVEEYFAANYQYSLQIDVPEGNQPLPYFLREKPAAHCEYFATAAVLLLRASGVPARYAYGYLGGGEYNHLGRYWIVRQQNAHAWGEVYVDGEGWQVVEATPSAGVHRTSSAPHVSHLWDNLLLKMHMIRALLSRGGGRATLQAAWILFSALFTTLPGLGVTAILSIIAWRVLRPYLRRPATLVEVVSPSVRELRKLLARVDRRLGKRQLARGPGETLHQFASRLQQIACDEPALQPVADWYLQYAATRYGTDPNAEQALRLRKAARLLSLNKH